MKQFRLKEKSLKFIRRVRKDTVRDTQVYQGILLLGSTSITMTRGVITKNVKELVNNLGLIRRLIGRKLNRKFV